MASKAKKSGTTAPVDELPRDDQELVHLARLALAGQEKDVQLLLRRMARRLREQKPAVAAEIVRLLREAPSRSNPLRSAAPPMPVDLDSRLQLVRVDPLPQLSVEPIWDPATRSMLEQLVAERQLSDDLELNGLSPTRTALFTGAPGVGKTLAAGWLARQLRVPLLTLDLSAVMSSFLGRTGTNVRQVLDYARRIACVLLLDEFDAVAKRRDDATDVGELKRLVTVLLQEIDVWPTGGLLVASTNHPELLDPAVWRRFEVRLAFPMPGDEAVRHAVDRFLGPHPQLDDRSRDVLAGLLRGCSFSDIERTILHARRAAMLRRGDGTDILDAAAEQRVVDFSHKDRIQIATELVGAGLSQRRAHELTGVSRDTIRAHRAAGPTLSAEGA